MRVQRGAPGRRPGRVVAQEVAGPGSLGGVSVVGLIEELGQAAPSRPAGQDCLLIGPRQALLRRQPVEEFEDGEIRRQLGRPARWSEVALACGAKRYAWGASSGSSVQLCAALTSVSEISAIWER